MSASPENRDRYRRRFVLVMAIVLIVLFFVMIRDLLVGVLAGILLWWATHRLYDRLLALFNGRKGLAAGICVFTTFVVIIVPVTVILTLLAVNGGALIANFQEWYEPLRPQIESRLQQLTHGRTAIIMGYEIGGPDVARFMERLTTQVGLWLIAAFSGTVSGIAIGLLLLLVTLYTLYFFYVDGLKFIEWLKCVLPLTPTQSNVLLKDFFITSRAILKSLLVIGLMQGGLGGLALWAVGIPAPIFWTLVMAMLSVVPVLGPSVVLIPAGLLLMLTGKIWAGIALLVWTLAVVSTIDNILRPMLVSHEARIHELLVFLSTLGGIAVFGVFGFLLGPVIVSLLRAIMRMYIEIYGQPPEPAPQTLPEK